MEIEFDPDKNAKNQAKHGLAFEQVLECDWHSARYEERHGNFEERRYMAVVNYKGIAHVVVFTYRNQTMRIMSFRLANRKERARHGQEN